LISKDREVLHDGPTARNTVNVEQVGKQSDLITFCLLANNID